MPEINQTGQDSPAPSGTAQPSGILGARPVPPIGEVSIVGAAATGSHPVLPAGVDEDLPDDADDVADGVPPPRASRRVHPGDRVIQDSGRRSALRRRRAPG